MLPCISFFNAPFEWKYTNIPSILAKLIEKYKYKNIDIKCS